MFQASHPFPFFDYFRVPYRVLGADVPGPAAVCRLRIAGEPGLAARSLCWLGQGSAAGLVRSAHPGRYRLANFSFFGHVTPDGDIQALLPDLGHGWHQAEPIAGPDGRRCAAIWRDSAGSVLLPFDPGEVMQQFWSESYRDIGRGAVTAAGRAALLRSYYLVRPALPRPVQLRLRRGFTRVQARSSFPQWPIEDSLHDLYAWLFTALAELAGRPVPFLGPWPAGRSWALVLTHDVETDAGCRGISLLRDVERARGYRSSWNFVPRRYRVAADTLSALHDEGCEIGVHGLWHDGRDLGSRRLLDRRLPEMRAYAGRWNAVGFRSPGTQRAWDLMPLLGFDYDSSYSDTDPYEPQPGGCCSYLPYRNRDMVELPITLPQDHTLFCILHGSGEVWLRKAEHLRQRAGMALVLTHPDYAPDPRVVAAYQDLLDAFQGDESAWHALPGEVAAWWRQRAASTIRADGGGWRIDGPASARGQVLLAAGNRAPSTM